MVDMSATGVEKDKQFGYHNSTDNINHFEYIILEIDGAYYVGFDFCANGNNPNQQVDRDWIFNDWIVKISPALPKQAKEYNGAKRIIAEDLFVNVENGVSSSDWDFNDVVFDAVFVNGKTVITLLAAGGTLPLYVGEHEVHEEFGVSTSTIVNTNYGVSKDPVTFTIDKTYNDIKDIPVKVEKDGVTYELTAEKGKAPQKICVGTDYTWCDEKVNINTKYSNFSSYVTETLPENWWK